MKSIKTIKYIFSLFIVWRIALLTVAWSSIFFIQKNIEYKTSWLFDISEYDFINIWFRWDAGHYNAIALNGYAWINHAVFFPLYPILIRITSYFIPLNFPTVAAGLLVSNLSLLVALCYFYRLVKLDYNDKISKRALLYLLLFPMSIFLASIYSESIFLMLAVSSFYYARKQNWVIASFLAFFACLTRLAGIFLFLGLLFEYLEQHNFDLEKIKIKEVFILFLALFGIIFYMIFLYFWFGDPLLFISGQEEWGRNFKPVWQTLIYALGYFVIRINNLFTIQYLDNLFEFAYFIFFILLSIFIWKKIRKSYAIYMLASLAAPVFSGSLTSINRYTLVLFPAFIYLSLRGNNKKIHFLIVLVFSAFLIYHTVMFANLYWVG